MVGSCLLDQRDTEVQLVQIVQNLIDPRYNFASMFLEGLVNMLIISDEIWIHEGKHVDDLAVRLKDAEILCIWFFRCDSISTFDHVSHSLTHSLTQHHFIKIKQRRPL